MAPMQRPKGNIEDIWMLVRTYCIRCAESKHRIVTSSSNGVNTKSPKGIYEYPGALTVLPTLG